jgi:alanyl-tRNA synthetase
MVDADRLRFDFTHYEKISASKLEEVENWVNERILLAVPVNVESHSINEAKAMGAMALFDEKYKEIVRVVKIEKHSMELCGGTHVQNTGEIGLFKILSETAVSAGMRRIDAITGWESLSYTRKQNQIITEACDIASTQPESLTKVLKKTFDDFRETEKKMAALEEKWSLKESSKQEASVHYVQEIPYSVLLQKDLQKNVVRSVADQTLEREKSGMVIVINEREGLVDICVKISPAFVQKPFFAGKIAQGIAVRLEGNGGGKPDFAIAGGKNPSKIPEVLRQIEEIVRETL